MSDLVDKFVNSTLEAFDKTVKGQTPNPSSGSIAKPGGGVLTVEEQLRQAREEAEEKLRSQYAAGVENFVEKRPEATPDSSDPGQRPGANQSKVDIISRGGGYGELSKVIQKSFYGLNHRGFGNPVPRNKDHYGLTFFTRPRLNLSYDNISRHRKFAQLLTGKKDEASRLSIHSAIHAWLDRQNGDSPLVDPLNPWLTILTNNLISISGWQDPVVDTFTSNAGVKKEEWSMADGSYKVYQTFDITATFKNIVGDPITLLFDLWCEYQTLVYEGWFMPDQSSIVENEIDYQTRIYRLVLDPTRNRVEKIAACGAAFPLSVPMGSHFDYTNDVPINDANDQISIPFRCIGAEYLDPVSIKEFNETLMRFNRSMWEDKRSTTYQKLKPAEKMLFNYEGYPYINLETYELELWVRRDIYERVMASLS